MNVVRQRMGSRDSPIMAKVWSMKVPLDRNSSLCAHGAKSTRNAMSVRRNIVGGKTSLLGNIRLANASGLAVFVMALAGTTTVVNAAGPPLQGQVTLRPLTPQEITDYALTDVQGASGLSTIGVGQPAYLEVLVNN